MILRFLDDLCEEVNKDERVDDCQCCVVEFNLQQIAPGEEIVIFFSHWDAFRSYQSKNEMRVTLSQSGKRLFNIHKYGANYLLNPMCRGDITTVNRVSDQFILETVKNSIRPTDVNVSSEFRNIKVARNRDIERYYSLQVFKDIDPRVMRMDGINMRNFKALKSRLRDI